MLDALKKTSQRNSEEKREGEEDKIDASVKTQ